MRTHTETLIAPDYLPVTCSPHTHTFLTADSRLLHSFSLHSFDYRVEQADSLSSSYPVQEWARLWCALSIPFISSAHCSVPLSALSTEKTMLVHNTQQRSISLRKVCNPRRFKVVCSGVGVANKHLESQRLSKSAQRKIPDLVARGQTRDKLGIQRELLFEILQTASWPARTSPWRIHSPL